MRPFLFAQMYVYVNATGAKGCLLFVYAAATGVDGSVRVPRPL
jgi:hypothetical protein